jgi:hypothetical protein
MQHEKDRIIALYKRPERDITVIAKIHEEQVMEEQQQSLLGRFFSALQEIPESELVAPQIALPTDYHREGVLPVYLRRFFVQMQRHVDAYNEKLQKAQEDFGQGLLSAEEGARIDRELSMEDKWGDLIAEAFVHEILLHFPKVPLTGDWVIGFDWVLVWKSEATHKHKPKPARTNDYSRLN